MRRKLWLAMLLALAGLANFSGGAAAHAAGPRQHHRLQRFPRRARAAAHGDRLRPDREARRSRFRSGGAAYLASAVRQLRAANPNSVVVAAGDVISASPLVSAEFLDEPTILAMNMIGLDYTSVGNHEFDRGRQELLRMQNGGCARHTNRQPCRLDRFPGARFRYPRRQCPDRERTAAPPGHRACAASAPAGAVCRSASSA